MDKVEFDIMVKDWKSVPVSQLVNMCAIRKAPLANGDRSYMGDAVWIKDISSHGHITYRHTACDYVLSPIWNDMNWVKAPDSLCASIAGFTEAMSRQVSNNNKHVSIL